MWQERERNRIEGEKTFLHGCMHLKQLAHLLWDEKRNKKAICLSVSPSIQLSQPPKKQAVDEK